ncbi:sensor histidine kinase [Mycobacterium branderi]|uniref:Anti-sigma regulatory factor n=1 Tax=Mycobacterium branderi TaxID=43348 RepID=A0AA91LSV8_9MYCO|nr:sensor histidine kinase [Mycobacterium branderi]MCV7236416.1 sensor histidine kinase [Mycobacterium branderi]ORA32614.1 hypothetical protein BST20_24625 [Mycobacterium branderi]
MSVSSNGERPRPTHCALLYRDEQEYLDAVLPIIADGITLGEPVLIGATPDKLAVLREALGAVAAEVTLADITEVGRNPGRILGVLSAFVAMHSGRPVRMVGEPVWPARSAEEYPACVEHEVLVNRAFAGRQVLAACPYDAGQLDERVLADARTTHPWVCDGGSTYPSDDYAPDEAWARYNQPLSTDPTASTFTVTALTELSAARLFVAEYGRSLGLPPARVADLKVIATELATNSLQRTGAACKLALWQHNDHVVCQASDSGRLDDPLAGHRQPFEDPSGRGLFLVNAIADLVRTHTTTSSTTIQAHLRLPAPGNSAAL